MFEITDTDTEHSLLLQNGKILIGTPFCITEQNLLLHMGEAN